MPQYTVQDTTTGKKITFEWNGEGSPTDTDMEEVFSQAYPQTVQPEEKGLLGKLAERASNIGEELSTGSFGTDTMHPHSKAILIGGQVAGGVNDIIGAAIDPILKKGVEMSKNPVMRNAISGGNPILSTILNPDVQKGVNALMGDTVKGVAQKGSDIYKGLKEKYPEPVKHVEAVANIASLIPIGKGAQVAKAGVISGVAKAKGVQAFERAIDNTFKENMPKILAGYSRSKNTYPQLVKGSEKIATAGKDIVGNKDSLKFIDSATGVEIAGKVPTNLSEMVQAWNQRMKDIWSRIDASIKEAGGAGVEVDITDLGKDLESIVKNKAGKVFLPHESNAAQGLLTSLKEQGISKLPLEETQQIISKLNANLGQLTTYKDIAQSEVDRVVLKNLRNGLDNAIVSYKGEGIKDIKKLYGSYLEGEKYLTKALGKQMSQITNIDFIDIGSASVAASSVLSGNIAGLAGSGVASSFNLFRRKMRNPDWLTKRMFNKAEKLIEKKNKYFPEPPVAPIEKTVPPIESPPSTPSSGTPPKEYVAGKVELTKSFDQMTPSEQIDYLKFSREDAINEISELKITSDMTTNDVVRYMGLKNKIQRLNQAIDNRMGLGE